MRPTFYEVIGFLDDDLPPSGSENNNVPVLGGVDLLGASIDLLDVDEVLIALSRPTDRVMDVIGECMQQGVAWKAVPHTYGLRVDRMWIDDFDGIPLVGTRGSRLIGYNKMVKRTFDVAVASVALLVLSPVLGLVALAVKLTSKGPVLYRQTRVGIHGLEFQMLKFRSMRTDSSTDIHTAFTNEWIHGRTGSDEDGEEAVHKIERDPRVTGIGRIIRRDQHRRAAPVLERPPRRHERRGPTAAAALRGRPLHRVAPSPPGALPGITGSWQVSGRNTLSFDEMVALDVAYIEGGAWRRTSASCCGPSRRC